MNQKEETVWEPTKDFKPTPRQPGSPQALRDCLRALPVVAVVLMSSLLYVVYVWLHCGRLLQVGSNPVDSSLRTRGILEIIFFHIFFVLFITCFILTIITPAGSIPDTPEWQATALDEETSFRPPAATQRLHPRIPPPATQFKRTGSRRYCKWCSKLKPDRAHHCRVCRRCVLRMDHHCPWVYNCIGYENHKYFFLLVFYSALTIDFAVGTQAESVANAVNDPDVPFGPLFLLLFAESLGVLMALVCTGFFIFHFWLTCSDTSTIEFCEKQFRQHHPVEIYDLGCYKNLQKSLGTNPLLWVVPIDNRFGDGFSFETSKRADEHEPFVVSTNDDSLST